MSQQYWNQPGPQQGGYQQPQQWGGAPVPPQRNQGRTLWWIVIGVASAVLATLLIIGLTRGGNSPDSPNTPGTTTQQPGGGEDEGGGGGGGGGGTDPGSVSVASATLPEALGRFQKVDEETFPGEGVLGIYEDGARTMYVTLLFDRALWEDANANLEERQQINGFECGLEPPVVVVAGQSDEGVPTCNVLVRDGIASVASDAFGLSDAAALLGELLGKL